MNSLASTRAGESTLTNGRRTTAVLAVLSMAAFMASLDAFIVNVAFESIGDDFRGASLSDLSWVLNAYTIVYAALLIPAGRLADRYGQKTGFLIGVAMFTVASAACAASPGVWWLIGFRTIQAVGAAVLTPASLGLTLAAVDPARRVQAVRLWSAVGALAAGFGPVVGGLLVEIDWRWIFLINVPIGIAVFGVAAVIVPRIREHLDTRLPDFLGAMMLIVAIGSVTLGLVQGPKWGWGSVGVLVAWVTCALTLAAFAVSMFRHSSPVIPPALLRVRSCRWSNATAVLFSIPFGGLLLSSVLWMQQVWDYSAIRTGLAVAPGPLMVPIFAIAAHKLSDRIPVGLITAAGCLFSAAGAVTVAESIDRQPAYVTTLLPGWIIGGVGVGLALPSILSSATAELPPAQSATGSAMVNMSRQLGLTIGVSVVVAVLGAPASYQQAYDRFHQVWWILAIFGIAAAAAALFSTPGPADSPPVPLSEGRTESGEVTSTPG